MKNKLKLSLILPLIIAGACAKDFRKVNLGMDIAQVTNTEPSTPVLMTDNPGQGNGVITYDVKYRGIPTDLAYQFEDGVLIKINLEFEGCHESGNIYDYYKDYQKIENHLTKKQGIPIHTEHTVDYIYSGYKSIWEARENVYSTLELYEYVGGMIYFGLTFEEI